MPDAQTTRITGAAEYQAAVRDLIGKAQMSIALYSVRLAPEEYADSETIEVLRHWVLNNRRASVRILIHEPRSAMTRPNRLIRLGQQLSSYFQFRDTPAQHAAVGDMLIIDRHHLLRRAQSDSRSATLTYNDSMAARQALKQFDAFWEESLPSQELRSHPL